MINRSALIVKAKQPFHDWVTRLSDLDDDSVTLESMNEDRSTMKSFESGDDTTDVKNAQGLLYLPRK